MVDRALERLEKTGDAEKYIDRALKEDFVGTLQRLASYAPKQVDMSLEQTVAIDTTQLSKEILREMFTEKEKREGPAASPQQIH